MPLLRALLVCLAACPAAAAPPGDGTDPPASLAALSWGLAEIAVDLDLPLTGVADVQGYADWVATPPLPAETVDLGLRNEPNLEALSDLAPALIVGSDQQAGMEDRLAALAPTWIADEFSATADNAEAARDTYRRLARAFGKSDRAEARLTRIDAAMATAGDRVRAAWGERTVPPVLPVRLLTPTTVRIHGTNSMAAAALRGMGLTPAADGPPTEWGFSLTGIEALADYPDAAIVHIDPFPAKERLFASPLWQAIPAVAADRFATAEPAWTFGGVVSLETLATRFADALVAMAPS